MSGHALHLLTTTTSLAKSMSISKESGPIEPTLQDFGRCLVTTEMSTTSRGMTESQDTVKLILWDTTPNDLVRTVFEQMRIIPVKELDLRKESVLV